MSARQPVLNFVFDISYILGMEEIIRSYRISMGCLTKQVGGRNLKDTPGKTLGNFSITKGGNGLSTISFTNSVRYALVSFTLLQQNTYSEQRTRRKVYSGFQFRKFQLVVSWLIAIGPVLRQDMAESACRKRAIHLLAARKG